MLVSTNSKLVGTIDGLSESVASYTPMETLAHIISNSRRFAPITLYKDLPRGRETRRDAASFTWIESQGSFTEKGREKLERSIVEHNILNHKDPNGARELVVEYFDDRGQNRHVLLVLEDDLATVLKYTKGEVYSAGENPVEQYNQMGRAYIGLLSPVESNVPPPLIAEPLSQVVVDGTHIQAESFRPGLTRGDILAELAVLNDDLKNKEIRSILIREEARSLASLWTNVGGFGQGMYCADQTERNIKFGLQDGVLRGQFFDFESASLGTHGSALSGYLTNNETIFLRDSIFILGWCEGLGVNCYDLLRTLPDPGLMIESLYHLVSSISKDSSPQLLFGTELPEGTLEDRTVCFAIKVLLNGFSTERDDRDSVRQRLAQRLQLVARAPLESDVIEQVVESICVESSLASLRSALAGVAKAHQSQTGRGPCLAIPI